MNDWIPVSEALPSPTPGGTSYFPIVDVYSPEDPFLFVAIYVEPESRWKTPLTVKVIQSDITHWKYRDTP